MALNKSWTRLVPRVTAAALLFLPSLVAQGNLLSVEPPAAVPAKRGSTVQAKVKVVLQPGYHANSNTPTEDYLIPLKLTWTPGPLESPVVSYPKPQLEKYEFSDKPISVFTGNFELTTTFKVPSNAPVGPSIMAGKLRYQACNNKACFPPKTVELKLPVQVQ
jgi:Thiol:disulfide interchange protein DsbD, N-terminal